ncbi:MAG: thrombospondin type 3 repeat-containing protein [Candidatus Poseidoniaceae archaeon]|nr:thrombospondin type 3 repeat-containing protein [Candidatus Poseidoniaceae archaeon]
MRKNALTLALIMICASLSGCLGEDIVDIEEDPNDPNPSGYIGFMDNTSVDGFRFNGATLERALVITEVACMALISETSGTEWDGLVGWDSTGSVCFMKYSYENASHPNEINVYDLQDEEVCFGKGEAYEYCWSIKVSGRVMWFDAYGFSNQNAAGTTNGAGHCGIYIESERLTLPGPIVIGEGAMNYTTNTWNQSILDLMADQQYVDWDLDRMNAYAQESSNAPSWCTAPVFSEYWWASQPAEAPQDDDDDGVLNDVDLCPLTPAGESVDTDGCSQSQLDDDGDGVMNDVDLCPNTPAGTTVDATGCEVIADADGDGVADSDDQCPNTPAGEAVDTNGCSQSQLDDDGDGVMNNLDLCPNTPAGTTVDATGCVVADADGDGVADSDDNCPNTPAGESVDTNGCHGGAVVTWGANSLGGDSSSVSSQLSSGVIEITSTENGAFAALKSDGSVVTWGSTTAGGDSSSVATELQSGVVKVYSNHCAFFALKSDGSVVGWGGSVCSGDAIASNSQLASDLSSDVVKIYTSVSGFAALKSDGSVVIGDSSGFIYEDSNCPYPDLSSDIIEIFPTRHSFAAIKSDGSAISWGEGCYSDSSAVATELASGVDTIYVTRTAFAALKSDGSVVTWGSSEDEELTNSNYGGDSSSVASQLTSGVTKVTSTLGSFLALKSDGSTVHWGSTEQGPNCPSLSDVSQQLSANIVDVFSNSVVFGAITSNGELVTFGGYWDECEGGDSSSITASFSNVQTIYSNDQAFAALMNDGTVVTWGNASNGGDSSSVSSQLTNVEEIYTSNNNSATMGYQIDAFMAIKSDGTVVTWGGLIIDGEEYGGGDSSSVASQLVNIIFVAKNPAAFAVIVEI